MKRSAIRHLASSWAGRILVAAEFESLVSIWNLETRRKTTEFPTILDYGGERLAINNLGTRCIAGAYQRKGICCYDTQNGEVIWHRQDLKHVQEIAILRSESHVICGFEDGPLHILSLTDGKTLQKIRGCRSLKVSQFEPIQLVEKSELELQTLDGSRLAIIKCESPILSVVFGKGAVVISESGGLVSCFETLRGGLVWRYHPPKGNHALKVGYNFQTRQVLAIEWPYEEGGKETLLAFNSETGAITNRFTLKSGAVQDFCLEGSRVVSSEGWILNTVTGEITGTFDFPLKEYSDE